MRYAVRYQANTAAGRAMRRALILARHRTAIRWMVRVALAAADAYGVAAGHLRGGAAGTRAAAGGYTPDLLIFGELAQFARTEPAGRRRHHPFG